ncbi:hypothetical protein [Corallococcus macrosporus]|uniref:Lipoprotein n=1 Tax=Corallococcus macrosporus DSM 14697 TaxID=1189310 RepID=A0A286NW66_9BACT|nr:hypothetical protein [Corallococcus macrosporus]ATB51411.1 hypothetical protein MYMAC_007074 [Corallococcus macrosporus DSM 14697]
MHTTNRARWMLLTVAMLLAACGRPGFVIPGATPLKPNGQPAQSIVVACDDAPQRVFVSKRAQVRVLGPLKVTSEAAELPNTQGTQDGGSTATGSGINSLMPVQHDSLLVVNVGKLERSGSDWGALCFCWNSGKSLDCKPDCNDEETRIDVRISCPATRFAKREAYGPRFPPLPAHIPVELECRTDTEEKARLRCMPQLSALEGAKLSVFGALQLATGQATVEPDEPLVFSRAPNVPLETPTPAFLCLHGACSNPAYFLPLTVTIKKERSLNVNGQQETPAPSAAATEPPSSKDDTQ